MSVSLVRKSIVGGSREREGRPASISSPLKQEKRVRRRVNGEARADISSFPKSATLYELHPIPKLELTRGDGDFPGDWSADTDYLYP